MLHKSWVALNEHENRVGLREIVPVPEVGKVIFLSTKNAKNESIEELLSSLELAKCPSTLELLKEFMIPFWEDKTQLQNWTKSGKMGIAELILRNFLHLDPDSQKKVTSLAIIPVKRIDGKKVDKFATAKELIDPSKGNLRDLFFDNEEACPVDWVLDRYRGILIDCGLRITLNVELVLDRVKCFADKSQDAKEVSERARKLLQSVPEWKVTLGDHETHIIRSMQWLPARDLNGECVFKDAQECRSLDDKLLVGLVLPVLNFRISEEWRAYLGWNHPISCQMLLTQLESGIGRGRRGVIDAVLKYIEEKGQFQHMREELMKLSCVVSSGGQLVTAKESFITGCERLQPYLYNVDSRFWQEHTSLLEGLGIMKTPNLDDLLRILGKFPTETPLDENDIPIAIEIIRLASVFPRRRLSTLRILDGTGRLRAIGDISYDDLGPSVVKENFNTTHPDLPIAIITALQIGTLSERVKKDELGIVDVDEHEFDQREDVAAGISDTISRYSAQSTFKEFLANAEDCRKAGQLNWLLDERYHPQEYLLTPELKDYQGPAMLVHNDGGEHNLRL